MDRRKIRGLCLIAIVVSFLGFWVENIWIAATKGYINNRSMILPFLLGYGLATVALWCMFGTPTQPRLFGIDLTFQNRAVQFALYYLLLCLCVTVGEILLGTAMEFFCGIKWWDYSNLPLNITKYTTVPTSLGFGFLIFVFMRFIFEPLLSLFSKLSHPILDWVTGIAIICLTADMIRNIIWMYHNHKTFKFWKIFLSDIF